MTVGPLGERLSKLRTERALTQESLSDRSGISLDLIKKLEQGRRTAASLASLSALADALGVPLSHLFDETPRAADSHCCEGEPTPGRERERHAEQSVDDDLASSGDLLSVLRRYIVAYP